MNAVIELGGPEALSPLAVVAIFEEVLGKSFEVQLIPEAALRAQKTESVDPTQQSFTALMIDYAGGDAIDMLEILQGVLLHLTSVKD